VAGVQHITAKIQKGNGISRRTGRNEHVDGTGNMPIVITPEQLKDMHTKRTRKESNQEGTRTKKRRTRKEVTKGRGKCKESIDKFREALAITRE